MSGNTEHHGLVATLASGVKDIPRNASWLLGKAVGSDSSSNESFSLAIPCDSQEEIDRLWEALVEGGEPSMCGWLKDRYGFSWQVYPAVLDTMLFDSDPEKVQRVTAAFMQVDRRAFVISELEDAFEGRA